MDPVESRSAALLLSVDFAAAICLLLRRFFCRTIPSNPIVKYADILTFLLSYCWSGVSYSPAYGILYSDI